MNFGLYAVGGMSTSPKNTIYQLKRLLGKDFNDPSVQRDLEQLPYTVSAAPDGKCLFEVNYLGTPTKLRAEQLMAALLVDLRAMAEKEQGSPVTEAVVAVPVYYTEAERYAMLTAVQVAGLNCLRLMDETTATALAYGIYKTDLPEDKPIHVAFVDVGHSSTQVCVVALKKGQLQVLSNAWDRDLGGRNFDDALFQHFEKEFNEKYKINVRSNARSSLRLRLACERVKKVLTTNSEAPISVESLTPDIDANSMVTRDVFEAASADTLDRLLVPVAKAVKDAGLEPIQVDSIEMVGGSTRVPAVLRLLSGFFGKEPSRTLNSKETPARGCALQCAMLSPAFKVRDYQVLDSFPYGVQFSWDKDGEKVTSVVFERGSHVPSAKMLTFYRDAPFDITAEYTPDSDIPSTAASNIGTWRIGPFTVPPGSDKAKLKVKVMLNLNGIVCVDSVHVVEELEVEEEAPAAAEDTPMADAGAAGDAPAPAGEAEAADKPKKKKTKKTAVPFEGHTSEMEKTEVQRLYEAECQMALQARIQEETNDARNAVESYIYNLRNRLSDSLAAYVREEDKAGISSKLDGAEDWLYEDGEDQAKSVYVAKLEELRKLGGPIEVRAAEDAARPAAAEGMKQMCNQYLALATGGDARFAHIAADEMQKVADECQKALTWLAEKESAQAGMNKYDDPVLLSADIAKKVEMVQRFSDPILSKPPPKPEPKAEPAAEAPKAEGDGMEVEEEEIGPQPPAEREEGDAAMQE